MYCVLFDIDGTLVQTTGAGIKAFAATFAQLFDVEEISKDIPFAGRSDRAITLDLMKAHGIDPSVENWQRFTEAYLQQLDVMLPQCQGQVLPGVLPLLDVLQGIEHVLLGLLTGNIKAGAARKLGHYGLADRFGFGGFGDELTDRNAIAQVAKEQAQANVDSEITGVMVIGDTVHDVRCAKSIDAFAVAVATGGASIDELAASSPDLLIEDLTNSEALLAEVLASGCTKEDATTRG